MERALIAAALVAAAAVVAFLLGRRRPDPPSQDQVEVPAQLDREDFARPEAPWLVAVFTSATCDSCTDATTAASVLASSAVALDVVPWQVRKAVHERYRIDTVPLTLFADADGVVRASFVGRSTLNELSAALATLRQSEP